MLNSSLWRTTTFRLSILFGAVFAVAMVLLLGLIYFQTAGYLTRRVDRQLAAESDMLIRSDPESIQPLLKRESARDPLNSFGLFSASGDRIAGDTPLIPANMRIDGTARDVPETLRNAPARALARRTPLGQIIIVERDTRQLVELRRTIIDALLVSGGLIVVLGLVSAILLSIRPLARIRLMQAASDTISTGDFSRRLPLDGSRDELDELARIANRMMDEAERLMMQARTVGEGAAHELRTPLTRLRALLDHACEVVRPDDPARSLIDQCVAETDGLMIRFRALLRIAALEARSRKAGIEPLSLGVLIEQVVELYEPVAAERDVQLELIRFEGDLQINADGELMVEAISNLIDNAIKFSPIGGRVEVRGSKCPSGASIEVRDNGPGIPVSERGLVINRFYRSQRDAHVQGHGLGLSVVAAIVALHGFELSFDDASPGTIARLDCFDHGD